MHKLGLSGALLVGSLMLCSLVYGSTHEFFRGNTLTLIAGTSAGSSIDVLARSVARVLSRHLGTQAIVVQNMPGAGGIVMTNHLAHRVKPDGATLGSYIGSSLALRQIFEAGARYDLRDLSWVGSIQPAQNTIIVDARKFKSVADLKKAKEPIHYALTGSGGLAHFQAILTGKLLGVKWNLISGFPGTAEISSAIQRGEMEATAASVFPFLPGIDEGYLIPLMVMSRYRDPATPKTPTVYEALGKIPSPLDIWVDLADIGRFIFGPPGIPQDRLDFLTQALEKTTGDPEFKALTDKQRILIQFIPGAQAKKTVADFLSMPQSLKDELKKLLGS